jgi:uncharacterized protein YodC (DUF2158 family)
MSTIRAGDVVRLKSGGPAMTVESMGGEKALCVWFEGSKPFKQMFQLTALALDDEPDSVEPDGMA